MKKNLILWLGALLITFLAGYLNSVTDKYHPITGTIGIEGEKVSYKFDKIHKENKDYRILIRTEKEGIDGTVFWRKEEGQNWQNIELQSEGTNLYAHIPKQEALSEAEYKVILNYADKNYNLPGPVKLKFFAEVHPMISFLFYFTLFGGLLISTRTGMEFFNDAPKIGVYTIFTTIIFFLFTLAVNPLKLTFELDALNKKVLPITDLFSVQSLLLLVIWILGMIVIFNTKKSKKAAFVFAILTILIFVLA